MAAHAIRMPKLGMTMEEGTVVDWPLAVGDPVAKGELALVIESEKTEADVEATVSGTLRHIYVEAGDVVPCGTLLAAVTDTPDEGFDADAFAAEHPAPAAAPAPAAESVPAPARAAGPATPGGRRPVAPAARALAKKLDLDVDAVTGTGPGGRVTKQDVEAFAEARERLVPVDEGVSLEVLREGEGPPVLLLPGFGTDVSSFAPQLRALAPGHETIGVNPRGVGASDAPELDAYPVDRAAADAVAALRQVGHESAHVVGASLGAAVAIEVALSAPESVRSLTLITPFVQATSRLAAVADAWTRVAADGSAETLARFLLPWLFSDAALADAAVRERTARGLVATVARVPAATLARANAGMTAWSATRSDALVSIEAPTLVLWGGADLLTPDAERLADAIPEAQCVRVPSAGHALAIEGATEVNEALLAHLARTS